MKVFLQQVTNAVWHSEGKMHIFTVIVAGIMIMLNNCGTWAIWISLEGCYRNVSGVTDNHTLAENNGPRHCFGICPNSTYIGLQDMFCFCDAQPVYPSYAIERDNCNSPCRGEKVNLPCGSKKAIYVYHQETLQLKNSISGEFGHVYVSVSLSGSGRFQFDYYATNNTSEEQKLICYDGTTCRYNPLGNKAIWEAARNQCLFNGQGFTPYHYDDSICSPQVGEFWIGVVWIIPVTTKDTTTSTTPTITESNTIASETRYIPLISHTSSVPKNETDYKENITPPGEKENKTMIVAVAVSISFAVLFAVVSVVICWKNKYLCFRLHQERNQEVARRNGDNQDSIETVENGQAFPATNSIFHTPTGPSFPLCVPPGSTYLKLDRLASSQQTNFHGDQHDEHNTSNQDTENGDGRRRKKKRKKDKKGRHRVRPTDESEEMAVIKEIGVSHPDASENERPQDKKKKKKEKKEKKTYDGEPDDTSAISGQTVVPHSNFGERENYLGQKRNVTPASEVKLTELIQNGTASNVNTSDDRSKGTQHDVIIDQKEKKKKRKRDRDLAQESVENTADKMYLFHETPATDAEYEDKIGEKRKKKQKRKKKIKDDEDTVHESLQ